MNCGPRLRSPRECVLSSNPPGGNRASTRERWQPIGGCVAERAGSHRREREVGAALVCLLLDQVGQVIHSLRSPAVEDHDSMFEPEVRRVGRIVWKPNGVS